MASIHSGKASYHVRFSLKKSISKYKFSLNQPSGPFQSLSCDVYELYVCLSVCANAKTPIHGELETFGIGATIRTHCEIPCVPCIGLFI